MVYDKISGKDKFLINFELEKEFWIPDIPDDINPEFLSRNSLLNDLIAVKDQNYQSLLWPEDQYSVILQKAFRYLPEDQHNLFIQSFPAKVFPDFFKFRQRHIKILPDIKQILPTLENSQISEFLKFYEKFNQSDKSSLEALKVDQMIAGGEFLLILERKMSVSEQQRSKIEEEVESNVLIEHNLAPKEYELAYKLTKKMHHIIQRSSKNQFGCRR